VSQQKTRVLTDLGTFLKKLILHKDSDFTLKMLQDHHTELFDCLDYENCHRTGKPSAACQYVDFITNEDGMLAKKFLETQTFAEAAIRRHRASFLFDYVFALDVPEDFTLFAGNVGHVQQMMARFNSLLVDSLIGNIDQLERFIFTDKEEAMPHVALFLSELMDLVKSVPLDKKMAIYRAMSSQRFKSCCQIFLKHFLQKKLSQDSPLIRDHCRIVLCFLELLGMTEKTKSKLDQHLFRDENPTEMIDLIIQFEEYSTFPYIC
jgi:hypothetical protein